MGGRGGGARVRCGQPWEGRRPEVGCCERERREAGVGGPAGESWAASLVGPCGENKKRKKKKEGGGLGRKEGEGREFFFLFFLFFKILFQTNISNTFKFKYFTQLSPTFPQLF
jgi:hypothetical protein